MIDIIGKTIFHAKTPNPRSSVLRKARFEGIFWRICAVVLLHEAKNYFQ